MARTVRIGTVERESLFAAPDAVPETGLWMGPAEKNARKLALAVRPDTFSSPFWRQDLRNRGDF
jgi:hypothetical protein